MNPNRCIAQSRFRIIDIIFRRSRNHILKCNDFAVDVAQMPLNNIIRENFPMENKVGL